MFITYFITTISHHSRQWVKNKDPVGYQVKIPYAMYTSSIVVRVFTLFLSVTEYKYILFNINIFEKVC